MRPAWILLGLLPACGAAQSKPPPMTTHAAPDKIVDHRAIFVPIRPPPSEAARALATCVSQPFANAARNSRVETAYHPLLDWRRLSDVGGRADRVLVDPAGAHVLLAIPPLHHHGSFEARRRDGTLLFRDWPPTALFVLNDGYVHESDERFWGREGYALHLATNDPLIWALKLDGAYATTIGLAAGYRPGSDRAVPVFDILATRYGDASRRHAEILWFDELSIWGTGAIADDWRAAIATEDRTLRLYPASGVNARKEMDFRVVALDIDPHHVSAGGSSWFVVGTTPGSNQTVVEAFDAAGTRTWRVPIAHDATQPAVWGGGARVDVVGHGITAIDVGAVAWSLPQETTAYATAFAGGELAVGVGPALEILAPDGSVLQSFACDAAVIAPPAIAGDGTIFVATESGLWRATPSP